MSGGVDSSVAACLLLEQGYEVLGSHMRLVHLDGVEHGCCGPRARRDAEEVARIAGFSFEIADFSDEFERSVIADFITEHGSGRTPNPCVVCNGAIKFRAFLERADRLGLDFVATGHYAQTKRDPDGLWHLHRGSDRMKDQSYMLHMLGQRELARSMFPLGGLSKGSTRALAERFGLPVASKPDSQELCFAPAGDAGGFVRTRAPHLAVEGQIVDPSGRVLGTHDGAFAYTIGQRRRLGVSTGERNYVVDVDRRNNRIVVGHEELLARSGLVADRVTWVAGDPPTSGPFEAHVRIRYRGEDVRAAVLPIGPSSVRVEFRSKQRAIAPGQSVVFYRSDELLGGGRIMSAFR
jgi:tRNA-specific 2-thiouridylase